MTKNFFLVLFSVYNGSVHWTRECHKIVQIERFPFACSFQGKRLSVLCIQIPEIETEKQSKFVNEISRLCFDVVNWIERVHLFACFSEHTWNSSGYQTYATPTGTALLEERHRKERMRPIPSFQWWCWPMRSSKTIWNNARPLAQEVSRILIAIAEKRWIQCWLQGIGRWSFGYWSHSGMRRIVLAHNVQDAHTIFSSIISVVG